MHVSFVTAGMKFGFALALAAVVAAGIYAQQSNSGGQTHTEIKPPAGKKKVVKTDGEWKKTLLPMEYNVLRHSGTEQAFTGRYWDNHAKGTYVCAGCNTPLFSSTTKFESGTGWPSFYQPLAKDVVTDIVDTSFGMKRTEVVCSTCEGHLGHVFDDGPKPTGLRYCMNGYALKFIPAKK